MVRLGEGFLPNLQMESLSPCPCDGFLLCMSKYRERASELSSVSPQ
jgi:hypothetical protein